VAEAGFNARGKNLGIAATLDNWQGAGDARLFKIILSPEFADRLNLQQHTRELMKWMERDLGTRLEWVAAVHHNTDHPHVHIAVRGMDDKGGPLCIPREYIRSGLRGRAEELATDALGYRSPADAHEAQRRETLQNRYTSLDRILQRSNGGVGRVHRFHLHEAKPAGPPRRLVRHQLGGENSPKRGKEIFQLRKT